MSQTCHVAIGTLPAVPAHRHYRIPGHVSQLDLENAVAVNQALPTPSAPRTSPACLTLSHSRPPRELEPFQQRLRTGIAESQAIYRKWIWRTRWRCIKLCPRRLLRALRLHA